MIIKEIYGNAFVSADARLSAVDRYSIIRRVKYSEPLFIIFLQESETTHFKKVDHVLRKDFYRIIPANGDMSTTLPLLLLAVAEN